MSDSTKNKEKPPGGKSIDVRVVTTAAFFPSEGYEHVPDKQKLRPILHRAAAALGLTDTSGYIVTVNGNIVDPDLTFELLGLTGQVDLRWGPEAGAGG
jgi:hypothetical protein